MKIKIKIHFSILFIVLLNCRSEENTQVLIQCLKDGVDIKQFESTFSDLEYRKKHILSVPVYKANTLMLYIDTNSCVYSNKKLYEANDIFNLFYHFIENPKKISEYASSPKYATILLYSNSFGDAEFMKKHLDSIHSIYREVLNKLRLEACYQRYSKKIEDLSPLERENIEDSYPYNIFIYPYKRSNYSKPNHEKKADTLSNTYAKILVNRSNEILFREERVGLLDVKKAVKDFILSNSKVNLLIIEHDKKADSLFLDNVSSEIENAVLELRAEYLNKSTEEYTRLEKNSALYKEASSKYQLQIILRLPKFSGSLVDY